MACGYEDANDSNHLHKDPVFKLANGRNPLDDDNHLEPVNRGLESSAGIKTSRILKLW